MPSPRIDLEDDPTPLVQALGGEVRRRLDDPSFAALTETVRGAVTLRSAATPEAATITIGERSISIHHGIGGAEATVGLDPRGRWNGGSIEGASEQPELAEWARTLATPPERAWKDAASEFWAELASSPGAPAALLVVEEGSGDSLRFGEEGRAYEIRGDRDSIVALLEGRAAVIDEVFAGSIRIRGSFPEISVLSGAATRIRLGARDG